MPDCVDCGRLFAASVGCGRPRKRCQTCSPPAPPRVRVPLPSRSCPVCSESFSPRTAAQVYCGAHCVNLKREMRRGVSCADCGKLMTQGRGSLPQGRARCLSCRQANPSRPGGRRPLPPERWTCGRCGVDCERPPTKGRRPKWCPDCRRKHNGKDFSLKLRLSVYERDGWTCGICLDPVDPALSGTGSIWRASLDHIVPSARGGSDDLDNLRLAHFWCNCVRADDRTYTDEDFRRGATAA